VKERKISIQRKEKKFFGLTFFKIYDIIIIVKERKISIQRKEKKRSSLD